MTKFCAKCTHLTALWQVGLEFALRGASDQRVAVLTPVCVCGMCADDVKLDHFGSDPQAIAATITFGHPDAVEISLSLHDISDGYWRDPSRGNALVPV